MTSPKSRHDRRCRICGCTNHDCRKCIEKTGSPCYWVERDLCSACAPKDHPGLRENKIHQPAFPGWTL